ncbi:extracellular solute-binding protein [Neobacillus sp. MER 74]|uniref:ABC transporter substrate-binding protein n=1 Tax=Neobacillus sp. MER 74 TaxID=2939566 RepID=UPI00203A72BC|nr:extracellular solute-binding protein [Neobacillus sp. MER 74]MCM3115370.1 extracellular solute-binding protein [Neobacillus sp. MER 74]
MSKGLMKSFIIFMILCLTLVGCSSRTGQSDDPKPGSGAKGSDEGKTKISAFMFINDPSRQDLYREIAGEFMKENPDINVEMQFPGEYENVMKVKMAANDLPDIFDTHGWAKVRYGNYLADLRDEPWADELTDSIKGVVSDEDGKVYALPVIEAKQGIAYNAGLLEKYGIEVPQTLDELIAASEQILEKSNGKTVPFYFSGVDKWTIGQFFDLFANSLFITPEKNDKEALLNNSFDWRKWDELPKKFQEIQKKGLINKDVLTAKYSDLPKSFAEERTAFALVGPYISDEVHKINPDIKIGLMPVPAIAEGDKPNFSGGEHSSMGIWKDSKHPEEAKKLLQFFAKKENLARLSDATKLPSGIKGVTASHELVGYYEKYNDVQVVPYFDRVYLPNGIWDTMCVQGAELLADRITPKDYSDVMKKEVERLNNK